jgi:diguanylate cyclase (GGDEF)-like protein
VNKRRPPHQRHATSPPSPAAAVLTLDADGRVLAVDEVGARLLRLEPEALAGRPAAALLPGLGDVAATGARDVVLRRADGSVLAATAVVTHVAVGGGERQALVLVTPHDDAPVGLLEALGDHVYVLELGDDGSARSRFHGPGGERLLGGPPGDDPVADWARALHPDDRGAFAQHLRRLLGGAAADDVVRLVGFDGATRAISLRSWPSPAAHGVVVHGIAADVTTRSQLERVLKATLGQAHRERDTLEALRAEAERQARTDALTGVANRRYLVERLEDALARDADGAAVLLLDVDHFKRLNDAYGHATGDAVLVEVARRIRGAVRDVDDVARWGGEEFCILCRRVPDDDALFALAEGVRLAIERRGIDVGGVEVAVTASVGAVRAAADLRHLDDLVDAADRALYAAKRRGRNQTRLYRDWSFEDFVAEDPEAIRLAEALALTASVREEMSPLHPLQVADLSARTAERLGLPSAIVLRARLGGWLHDVGKVALPDQLITKRTALDEADWDVMRAHTLIGEEIIRRISGLREAAGAVRSHHEQFAGGGYPDGLVGEEIPIEARIVAVADAYSAMTSARPHAAPLERDEALAELRRCAGTQFDPEVVRALAAVLEEHWQHLEARLRGGTQDRRRDDRAA